MAETGFEHTQMHASPFQLPAFGAGSIPTYETRRSLKQAKDVTNKAADKPGAA